MKSIDYIPGSNGAGNASQMTVQNVRSPGASDILVNTVTGVPTKFYGSMGAPHTFTDPVTSETITIISEATAVDFAGHVDTGKLVIDEIAPGYVDTRGSLVGDIVVVRPNTEWSNNLFNILSQSHNDDGTLKDSAIIYEPTVSDFIKSGGVWSIVSGLNGAMTALTGYQAGHLNTIDAIATRAFTASKDTYIDVLRNSTTNAFSLVYTEVSNGAPAPALADNSMRLYKIVTSASAITSAVDLRSTAPVKASDIDFTTLVNGYTSIPLSASFTTDSKIYYAVIQLGVVKLAHIWGRATLVSGNLANTDICTLPSNITPLPNRIDGSDFTFMSVGGSSNAYRASINISTSKLNSGAQITGSAAATWQDYNIIYPIA